MKLSVEVLDALIAAPEVQDRNSPLHGMIEWMRSMATEVKALRLSKDDVVLLQVIQGVLSVDIEDSEGQRDAMKEVFPQFSDMCQGSVEDYKNADALMQRLIDNAKDNP